MEIKVYVYMALGLLIFIRAIINNAIFNARDKTNYSTFANEYETENIVRRFKVAIVFWLKPDREYRTKAIISNIMYILAIALFIYSLYL